MRTNRKMIKIQKKEKTITIKKPAQKTNQQQLDINFYLYLFKYSIKITFFRLDTFFWGGGKGGGN